jgi:hypothetical protein
MHNLFRTFWHKILQHKRVAIFLFVAIFCALEYATYIYDPHDSLYVNIVKRTALVHALENSREFYNSYDAPLQTDEYSMLLWLWPDIAGDHDRAFDQDPFYRFFSNDLRMPDLGIDRHVDNSEELAVFVQRFGVESFLYEFSGVSQAVLTDPTDDVILKALYCDVQGYDAFDYTLLRTMRDESGGYGDTHFLLGILFLTRLGCISDSVVSDDRSAVVARIIAAQKADPVFSDLYAERVVLLYWAGHGDVVSYAWIKKIQEAQMSDGGWRNVGQDTSDPHATGLSGLALQYFIENADPQRTLIKGVSHLTNTTKEN